LKRIRMTHAPRLRSVGTLACTKPDNFFFF
jgi:hypothetical protein